MTKHPDKSAQESKQNAIIQQKGVPRSQEQQNEGLPKEVQLTIMQVITQRLKEQKRIIPEKINEQIVEALLSELFSKDQSSIKEKAQ